MNNTSTYTNAKVLSFGEDLGEVGHEHLDDFGLINMNGRCYDPLLGRILSPDPELQDPSNIQNYNRYSYCLNNPLKYTDPSGYLYNGGWGGIFASGAIDLFLSADYDTWDTFDKHDLNWEINGLGNGGIEGGGGGGEGGGSPSGQCDETEVADPGSGSGSTYYGSSSGSSNDNNSSHAPCPDSPPDDANNCENPDDGNGGPKKYNSYYDMINAASTALGISLSSLQIMTNTFSYGDANYVIQYSTLFTDDASITAGELGSFLQNAGWVCVAANAYNNITNAMTTNKSSDWIMSGVNLGVGIALIYASGGTALFVGLIYNAITTPTFCPGSSGNWDPTISYPDKTGYQTPTWFNNLNY